MRRLICTLALAALFLPRLQASQLTLRSATSIVELDPARSAELAGRLDSYFQSCHDYSAVVLGAVLPQKDLRRLWTGQERLPHAVLHVSYGSGAPPHLRNRTLDVLFGFSSEIVPGPVLARDAGQLLTSYIKCPGLEALRLSCEVRGLIPGMKANPRCSEWEASIPQNLKSTAATSALSPRSMSAEETRLLRLRASWRGTTGSPLT